MLEQGRG